VYWQLAELGIRCEVVALTLVPVKAGDRVKTDRRDAEKLARCYRSADLTAVWVPDEVPRPSGIWCVPAKQPSRIRCERGIG
jgi:transposase